MSRLLLVSLAVAAALCTFSPPSFADDMKNGMIMMVMPDGKTSSMTIDKAKVDMMMKNAQEMKEGVAIFVWGNKTYMIHDEKMSDGKMMFDYWGLHGTR